MTIDTGMPMTATAVMDQMGDRQIDYAMFRLLCDLIKFVRVYPAKEGDELPKHDLMWTASVDTHPGQAILDALRANPALWLSLLPPEVCVVDKRVLEKAGVRHSVVAMAAAHGEMAVMDAARQRGEKE